MRKKLFVIFSVLVAMSMILAACATPTPETVYVTQEVVKEVEKVVTQEVIKEVVVEPTPAPVDEGSLPRNETMYFNGQQWNAVVCWNPYSSNCNNAMALSQGDSARVVMFETPYLYDMLDGKQYPLLADGDYTWNDAHTELTFKIKAAAKWSDGTPVTADDVAYTWDSNLKYETQAGVNSKDYIESITAVDPQTVLVKAKLDKDGKAINTLQVASYIINNYVIQKAWTQTLEKRVGNDATKFKADPASRIVAMSFCEPRSWTRVLSS